MTVSAAGPNAVIEQMRATILVRVDTDRSGGLSFAEAGNGRQTMLRRRKDRAHAGGGQRHPHRDAAFRCHRWPPHCVVDCARRRRTVLRGFVLRDFRQGQEQRAARWQSPMDVSRVLFPPREHHEPLRDPTFRDNILFWLLEERR